MSNTKATGWTFSQIPIWLICNKDISDGAKMLFSYLKYRQGTDAACWPSKQTMSFDLGYSIGTIERRLRELEDWEYIKKHPRTGRTNLYEIIAAPEGEREDWEYREEERKKAKLAQVTPPPKSETPPPTKSKAPPSPKSKAHDDNQEREKMTTHVASDAPTTILTEKESSEQPSPPEQAGDELLDSYGLGLTKRKPASKTRPALEMMAEPYAQWGCESEEFQRQLERFGLKGRQVQELGWNLEQKFGMLPDWEDVKEVQSWSSGLSKIIKKAGGDMRLVYEVGRKMRTDGLAIANPYSMLKMVGAKVAEKRSPSYVPQAVATYR